MKQLTDDLHMLSGFPPNAINVYVIGDVLIDAATKRAARRIMRQLRGREIKAHALTHAHPDHQGSSHAICEAFGIPLWCGAGDLAAMESGDILGGQPAHWMNRLSDRFWTGPAHPVARALREGDEVAGFEVLEVPGHSAGHVAYWRAADRALVLGDVLTNVNVMTGMPGLHEPLTMYTPDPARNRDSARKIAALEPALVCFGHGAPLRDPEKLRRFVAGLAEGK